MAGAGPVPAAGPPADEGRRPVRWTREPGAWVSKGQQAEVYRVRDIVRSAVGRCEPGGATVPGMWDDSGGGGKVRHVSGAGGGTGEGTDGGGTAARTGVGVGLRDEKVQDRLERGDGRGSGRGEGVRAGEGKVEGGADERRS